MKKLKIGEESLYNISRYSQKRILKRLSETRYLIYGDSHYGRVIGAPRIEAIDFEGGPYLAVGQNMYDLDGYIDKFEATGVKLGELIEGEHLWGFEFELVDGITNEIHRYQESKEETTKKVKEYVQDTSIELDKRWDIFILSKLGSHSSWYEEFKGINWEKFSLYDDFYCEKYQTLTVEDMLNTHLDRLLDKESLIEDIQMFKEDVLEKFIYSFKFDW